MQGLLTRLGLPVLVASVSLLASADPNTNPVAEPPESLATYLDMPPGERYRQLSFLLEITDGLDPDLVGQLDRALGERDAEPATLEDIETYQGAGYRIASSRSILEGIVELALFRQAAEPLIITELNDLDREYPELTARLDREDLIEESILIRTAVADSATTLLASEGVEAFSLENYRAWTIRLRNDLDFMQFAREMNALTDRHIAQTEGSLDAFHRMVDEGNDMAFLREQIQATEAMNEQVSAEHRRWAMMRMTQMVILMLPAISRYYRYR